MCVCVGGGGGGGAALDFGANRIKTGYHGNSKLLVTYNGKCVSMFSQSPLIRSLSNLQVTRTGIKSQMSLNLGLIGLFTTKLFVLERSH